MSKRGLQRRETRYVSCIAVWVGDAYSLTDMCRYDNCYPMAEVESGKVERLMGRRAEPADHVVKLVRVSKVSGSRPTFARWKSFNATVLREWHPEDPEPTDAELQEALCLAGLAKAGGPP